MKARNIIGPDSQSGSADDATWLRANEDHLAAGLHLLRLRLQKLAQDRTDATPSPPPVAQQESRSRWSFSPAPRPSATLALPRPEDTTQTLASAARAVSEAENVTPPPALVILGERLSLSRLERDVLFLCAAMELDTRIADLCDAAQGGTGQNYPTFALALTLFDDPVWEVMSPTRPLRYWRLIEISQPGARPLSVSALRADERIVSFLKGLNYLDDRLSPFMVPFDEATDPPLPSTQEDAVRRVSRALRESGTSGVAQAQLVGSDPVSKQIVAQHAASALDLTLYRMPVSLLPEPPGELETLARLWHRESHLLPIAVLLDAHDATGAAGSPGSHTARLKRFMALSGGVFLVSARESLPGLAPVMAPLSVARPLPAEQAALWAAAVPTLPAAATAPLSAQFDLNAPLIRRIARAHAGAGPEVLWQACLQATGQRMDQMAERLPPLAGWDDIVLPETEMAMLRQLSAQVAQRATVYDSWGFRDRMNRGLGISALFAGDSGTGKTMAAEVIAKALKLNLYRIDLSAVVSKYIGETEKNLSRLFDAAETGGAILFFDEADALFGKRSEVRDSHDRYANIETSYLLQRIETYRGLAILSTNKRSALDAAFLRRLRFVINFPHPGPAQRKAIWQRAWPAKTPVEALDFDRLARLSLAGGNIATAALNAAFMAAAQGGAVSMPLVLAAARTEYEKLERPVNEADFLWSVAVPGRRDVPIKEGSA